jgi:beta-lactamase class A
MTLNKKSIFYCLLSAVAGGIFTLITVTLINAPKAGGSDPEGSYDAAGNTANQDFSIRRISKDYKFIAPIFAIEPRTESEKYSALKINLNKYILSEREKGLTSAAVYFKKLSSGSWFSINKDERFDPGSLLKVGVLITYLRMAENDNNLLNKEIVYHSQPGFVFPIEHFQSDTILEGHKYTINALLRYMIRNSDNRATVFLEDHMDTTVFKKEFADLGITTPRFNDPNFTLNAKEYSMMFNALYNAGYLRKRASEDALALLSESVFKNGLLKGIPPSVVVAHKYGEFGNRISHELHESGIVYLDNDPYLITVMTRGTDWNEMSEVVGHISGMIYSNEIVSKEP